MANQVGVSEAKAGFSGLLRAVERRECGFHHVARVPVVEAVLGETRASEALRGLSSQREFRSIPESRRAAVAAGSVLGASDLLFGEFHEQAFLRRGGSMESLEESPFRRGEREFSRVG